MRAHRSTATIVFLLLLDVTIRSAAASGRCIRSRTAVSRRQIPLEEATLVNDKNDREKRTSGLPVIRRPGRINNMILSPVVGETDVQIKANAPTGYDQQVDQSRIAMINENDAENIQLALSMVEYESQKIKKKKKRKTIGISGDNPDSTISSSENAEVSASDADNTYYEVSRMVKPKTIVTSQYYSKSNHGQKLVDGEPKLKSKEIEYVYPVPMPVKVSRSRVPKNHAAVDSPTGSPTEEPKHENSHRSRVASSHRPRASLLTETRRTKNFVDQSAAITPSSDASYSTKPSRRRKSHQHAAESSLNSPTDATTLYNIEGKKSKRLSLVSKYDIAPRPFSRTRIIKGSQEDNVEKLKAEDTVPIRRSTKRNSHSNALKSNEQDSSGDYLKVTDRVPLTGSNRKQYQRKDSRESSVGRVNSPQPFTERPKQVEEEEIGIDCSSPYKNHEAIEKAGSSKAKRLKIKHAQSPYISNVELARTDSSSTPASLDVYQSIHNPVATSHSAGPTSIAITSTSPGLYSTNSLHYPPAISTLTPVQHFEVSTVEPRILEVKAQLNQRDVERIEDGPGIAKNKVKAQDPQSSEEYQKGGESVSDGVAAATNFGSEEGENPKMKEAAYEIQETLDEGHHRNVGDHDGDGHEYVQQKHSGYGSLGDGHSGHERDEGGKDDALDEGSSKSSHGAGIHQNRKEGAGGVDVSGKGNGAGDGKFEKGEGTVRQEGHEESEGEKGRKGYKSWHEDEKANKGQHDKERKNSYYKEKDGTEKDEKEEGGYHEEHEHGTKGEKQAKFDEKGEHQKGYSTKGQHFVHKKDEFEKRTEFFDEFNDEGDMQKDGEHYQNHEASKGDKKKVSHHDTGDHEEQYSKETKHVDGKHHHEEKGHNISEGEDSHHDKEDMHGEKKSQLDDRKWSYKKGDDEGNASNQKSDH